ncbi:flagellar hook-length control protein FliK [sulfur-oxidizing endosymbiont of Gigantopelta aegis]|uniref:flagellar hook-length control protein FliK n=1 Tax=sulfur-oxidizing endosymbiont of Gigantopelta aegis TaxID=2794934 RepID=UPI0018DC2C5A|nr:flagellar hook-length control protein FliK [sulfur-oxidizing endosymbiont of Gigantopelta aegis]
MNTANLLNIKATANNSANALTGQVLAMVSADKNDGIAFKSEFKNQIAKKKDLVRAEKDLPQNGNDLPKKKMANEKDDKDIVRKNNNDVAEKAKPQVATASSNDNNVEKANKSEQVDKPQQSTKTEAENKSEQQNNTGQENNSEQQNNTGQENNSEQNASIAKQENLESDKQINNRIEDSDSVEIPALVISEFGGDATETNVLALQQQTTGLSPLTQPSLLAAEVSNTLGNASGIAQATGLDKKPTIDATKVPFSLAQVPSNSANSSTISTSGEGKNESALSKSVADFQQYIDMSKKISMSGEAIASVKSFENNMKNAQASAQINAQFLASDLKATTAQTSTQTAPVSGVLALDKMTASLHSASQSLTKTTPSLDVKTGVGKSGWNQSFSNQILVMANNGIQHAKIKLNPLSLGPVEAMVRLSGETAVVNLSAVNLTTKDALENALPRLKEMLNENGFSQVDVNVSHQDKKQQQEAALDSKTGSNNEHGNSTMPGDEQLSDDDPDSEANITALDENGLKIVDYYA